MAFRALAAIFGLSALGFAAVRLMSARPPDQAYYWTPEWQAAERESEEDLARGDFETFETADEAIAWLTQCE